MACLGASTYDPTTAVSKSTTSLLAMTAIDTTNLRVTFTAPANGTVLVRLKGQVHGATTYPRLLFGVLDGSTVRGRMSTSGVHVTADATAMLSQSCSFLVTGLTPSTSYTFDAAYGVEIILAASALKYGGPNDATADNAFGAFHFEVWETTNLLAGTLYDPAGAVTESLTSLIAMTAMDTTNLRHTFTAPASGNVYWRIVATQHGNATVGYWHLGILDGSTVKARSPIQMTRGQTNLATTGYVGEASGVITGLTPSSSYTYDAAYGVETVAGGGGIKYGGPNDTTTDNAFGGIAYEIWAA